MRDEIVRVKAGWLIDGSGAAIQQNVQLTLDSGLIRSIQEMPVTASDRKTRAKRVINILY